MNTTEARVLLAVIAGWVMLQSGCSHSPNLSADRSRALAARRVLSADDAARLGEHGSPRLDTSEHVYFANDQLAVRFIEEIDFDYAAVDAMAALITAASSTR